MNENSNNSNNIDMLPLAMAYMPFQYWQKIYDPQAGFKRGTIFEELDLPYIGRDK